MGQCRYVSGDTPMRAYLNCAHIVNNQRKEARDQRPGPVVAVVGPPQSGKTSLAKILVNYAIRSGWSPLLVETDVRCSLASMPGSLSAVQVEVPIEPDEGLLADAPLAMFFGHTAADQNAALYKAQVDRYGRMDAHEGRPSEPRTSVVICS